VDRRVRIKNASYFSFQVIVQIASILGFSRKEEEKIVLLCLPTLPLVLLPPFIPPPG